MTKKVRMTGPTTRNDSGSPDRRVFRPEDLDRFVTLYEDYSTHILQPTRQSLQELFRTWRIPAYWKKYAEEKTAPLPSPVQRCSLRIKEAKSVLRKIIAKADEFPDGLTWNSFERMFDAVGARVVVYFLSSLSLLDREIRESGRFEISSEHPPHAYLSKEIYDRLGLTMERRDKASGYASIHYVLRLKDGLLPPEERPWFELQLRTITQDAWAEIEHVLGYKPNRSTTPQVKKQFQVISHLLHAVDEHFDLLQDEISHQQSRVRPKASDPLNSENLPGILAEHQIRCAQYDIKGLIKLAAGRGIKTVGDLRRIVTPERIQLVQKSLRRELHHNPEDYSLLTALLLLNGHNGKQINEKDIQVYFELLRQLDRLSNKPPTPN